MKEAVRRHDAVLIELVERAGGWDLRKKGEGDSHFIVFESAPAAALVAIEIHRTLASIDWGVVGPIRVRTALHSGTAELRDEDYFGQAVNRCARLRGVAHGGQTIVSESTRKLLSGQLPDDVSLQDLGSHRLKDLLEPERIFQLNAEGLESQFAPLASLSAAKHNLPVQLTSFVGREKQLADAKRLIFEKRLVSLRGAGGSGKTRLALQVAADVLDDFPDGVWFAPLAGIEDPSLVAQAIAEALPISLRGADPLDAIIDNFSSARALILVDNCEHLGKSPAEVVNKILRGCPDVAVLATSRQPLGVAGENVYDVPSMEYDLRGRPADVRSVARLEAVELLCDRAKSRMSDEDVLTDQTFEDILAICKKLDGIPLALEQAAANFAYKTPSEILKLLNTHFKLMALDEVGVEDRHRTIQATIDWSYSRLEEKHRKLFSQVSVFLGGFSAEAAKFVCREDDPSDRDFDETLQELVRRSLMVSERPNGLRDSRYRLLEPIREYASGKRHPPDEEKLHERHFEWMFNMCHQAFEAGLDSDNGRYARLLSLDHDNCRSALKWAIDRGDRTDRPLEMSVFLYRFWLTKGHIREGLTWLQSSMNSAKTIRNDLHALALLYLGILSLQQGNTEGASKALEESLRRYSALEDRSGMAKGNANLATLAFTLKQYEDAERYSKAAVDIFRDLGQLEFLAPTLENLGITQSNLGKFDESCASLEEVVAIRRKLGVNGAIAKSIDSLLGVYRMRGQVKDHMPLFHEAVDLAISSNDGFAIENLLELGVQLCMDVGEYGLAAQALGALEKITEDNQRAVPPNIHQLREKMRLDLLSVLDLKRVKQSMREGWGLGASEVLQFVSDCLDGS